MKYIEDPKDSIGLKVVNVASDDECICLLFEGESCLIVTGDRNGDAMIMDEGDLSNWDKRNLGLMTDEQYTKEQERINDLHTSQAKGRRLKQYKELKKEFG